MNLRKIDAALLTREFAAAEAWYTKLLGSGPDDRPMPSLVQWELSGEAGLALSTDAEIAGRGVVSSTSTMSRPSGAGCRGWDRAPGGYRGRLFDLGAGERSRRE